MKSIIATAVLAASLTMSFSAQSAEAMFDPNLSSHWYDVNSNGVLSLWGVPEVGGNALVANPDYGWLTTFSVASWYAVLLKAQEMGLTVVVGYDPNTRDIWYIGRPR